MEIITLEEMLESLREGIESELDAEGLSTWSINASGINFADNLEYYNLEDLKELANEISEGSRVEVTVDLSDVLLQSINQILAVQEDQERDEKLEEYEN